jgi:hypothetical protein
MTLTTALTLIGLMLMVSLTATTCTSMVTTAWKEVQLDKAEKRHIQKLGKG